MNPPPFHQAVRDGRLAGIASIHLLDAPVQVEETPYPDWTYVIPILGLLAAVRGDARAWLGAAALGLRIVVGHTRSEAPFRVLAADVAR